MAMQQDQAEALAHLNEIVRQLTHFGANYCDWFSYRQASRFHKATETISALQEEFADEISSTWPAT